MTPRRVALLLAVALAAAALPAPVRAGTGLDAVPRAALPWRRTVTAAAHQQFGIAGPVAMLAAQLQQESGWSAQARSGAGALGLAQFMPATAADMAARHPRDCAPADPWDPRWAITCAAIYDADLHRGMRAATRCDRWAMTLSAYNGGAGWIARDARKAAAQGLDPLRWWGHVETVNAGRAPVYWRENRGYPRRILRVIEPRYASWGPTACEVTP